MLYRPYLVLPYDDNLCFEVNPLDKDTEREQFLETVPQELQFAVDVILQQLIKSHAMGIYDQRYGKPFNVMDAYNWYMSYFKLKEALQGIKYNDRRIVEDDFFDIMEKNLRDMNADELALVIKGNQEKASLALKQRLKTDN